MTNGKNERKPTADAGVETCELLAASLGFEKCEFEPARDEECERCNKPNVQLYFGNRDYWDSREGEYYCIDCLHDIDKSNEEYCRAIEEDILNAKGS